MFRRIPKHWSNVLTIFILFLWRVSKCKSKNFSSKKLLPQNPHSNWLGRFCFFAACCGPNISLSGWNGHSIGNFTWYFSRIGSHFDCTIFLTTLVLSLEHEILKTDGPGHGMRDRKHMTITFNTKKKINYLIKKKPPAL